MDAQTTPRARSRSPVAYYGKRALDFNDIVHALITFGNHPEKRPPGLLMDSFGAVLLSDLMESWGYAQGLRERVVLDAIRRNMVVGSALRFAITTDAGGSVVIRVNPNQRQNGVIAPALPPPPLDNQRCRDFSAPLLPRRREMQRSHDDLDLLPPRRLGAREERFFTTKEEARFCLLCNQFADAGHLQSKKHAKRVANPEWYLESAAATAAAASVAPLPARTAADGVIDLVDSWDEFGVDGAAAVAAAGGGTSSQAAAVADSARRLLEAQLQHMSRDELIARVRTLEAVSSKPKVNAVGASTVPAPHPAEAPAVAPLPPPPEPTGLPLLRKMHMSLDAVIAKDEDMVD